MAEQDQNRNESATPYKLQDARKKGSVPKSLDINSYMVLLAALISLYIWGQQMVHEELVLLHSIFSNTYQLSFNITELSGFLTGILSSSLKILAPLFILLFGVAALSNFMQVGPVFTFFPLKPDLSRINPVTGFKRLFSIKLLIEAVKTVLKFILLGAVLYSAISNSIPKFITAFQIHPKSIGAVLFPEITSVLFKLLLALTIIAFIDLIYSRWDFNKRMRMSRRDITDEHKRREGDPRIKSRLRELQREALKRAKSLNKVKDADVLITNPTHFAIAIKYDKQKMDAPMVLAKGAGFLAGRMRTLARRHHVPVIENKTLARTLFHHVGIERAVPVEHFRVLAKILIWAYSIKNVSIQARLKQA